MKLAVIGGDGIGPEVTEQAIKVLRAVRDDVDLTHFDLGAERYLRTGDILPDAEREHLAQHDAILLGAVGAPGKVPPGVLERGLLLELRFRFDHHVNLRPVVLHRGANSPLKAPGAVDFVVVREGTEGLYCGNGGSLRRGTSHEVASEVSQNTRFGVERVVRDAFCRAQARRGQLTWVHKTNVLAHAGSLWERTVAEVGEEFPDVAVEYLHIDAATMAMVEDPARFDVIVTDNLFGDILTDLAASITGGIGLAASANIDTSRTYPSMFEPVHASAPDIAGAGIADPRASILSVALLLDHVGDAASARAVRAAVANDIESHDVESQEESPSAAGTTAIIGDRIAERVAATVPSAAKE